MLPPLNEMKCRRAAVSRSTWADLRVTAAAVYRSLSAREAGDTQGKVDAHLPLKRERLQRYGVMRTANQQFTPGAQAERYVAARACIIPSECAM
jgi:hypothetical protein